MEEHSPVDDTEQMLSAGLDGPLEGRATGSNSVGVLAIEQDIDIAARTEAGDAGSIGANRNAEAVDGISCGTESNKGTTYVSSIMTVPMSRS